MVDYYDKLNLRITYNAAGFRWFRVVNGTFQLVSNSFAWFQVVPRYIKYEKGMQRDL